MMIYQVIVDIIASSRKAMSRQDNDEGKAEKQRDIILHFVFFAEVQPFSD
jgi:hypothetical protein